MNKATKYFEKHEPRDDRIMISGQRVSKKRCIELMHEYAKELWDSLADLGLVCDVENSEASCSGCRAKYKKFFGK
jgi:hypothetical protein